MDKIIQARIQRWNSDPSDENAQALAAAVARTAETPKTRKVLVSRGYSGGFSWDLGFYSSELGRFVAEYAPLVAATEAEDREAQNAAMESLRAEVREKFMPVDPNLPGYLPYVLMGDAPTDLQVVEVSGSYRVTEYDGAESIETLQDVIGKFW